jgi:tRNA-uridine 2-sulfurtransferase
MLPNSLPPKKTRIAVAMSGGVDSTMAAFLLARQGYELVGFTAWTLDGPGKCCNDALVNAGRVCEQLGIPYDVVDLRDTFQHFVKDHFARSYTAGITPNPCVECNRHVKWTPMVNYALEHLDVDMVATGHYARLFQNPFSSDAPVEVYRAADSRKDQTYMMARVFREDLQKTVFPLGNWLKPDVVALAQAEGLPTAHSKESQDVCFVLDGQANYLKGELGVQPGPVVDLDTGQVVGEHEGHYLFTLGQRKGVKVAAGRPIYVVSIDATTNTVFVGDEHHLETRQFVVRAMHWINPPRQFPFSAQVKIRYNSPPVPATLYPTDTEGDYTVTLDLPTKAVTPGQIAVVYDRNFEQLLGGGYIEQFLPHAAYATETPRRAEVACAPR